MSRQVAAARCVVAAAGWLATATVPALAADAAVQALSTGNGQRVLVEARPATPVPSAPVTDTVWVNGQAVRVLREPGAAPAAGARAAGATPTGSAPPAGARAVTLSNGSKMWVLPER